MNVADLLSYADIQQLNRMAARLDCQCNTNSKQQLIQTILLHMRQRGIFGVELHELAVEELLFLMLLVFDRRDWLSMEELMAKASTAVSHTRSARPIRQLITEALASGWLFRGFERSTKDLFRFPRDLALEVMAKIRADARRRLQYLAQPPALWRDEGDSILSDLLIFLAYVHQHEVPLTAERVIYKRHLQLILKRMAVQESIPGPGWRFGYGYHYRDYPDRFSLLYDASLVLGLIREDGEHLTLTEKGLQVIRDPSKLTLLSIYRTWIRIYKHPIPLLPVVTHLIALLCDQWVLLPSLFAVVRPWLNEYYYDTPEQVFEQRIVKMMVHLGLLRMTASPDGTAVCLSQHGRQLIEQVRSFEAKPIPTPITAR